MVKIAINGFGRIGRNIFRICIERGIKISAINDLGSLDNMAYLLKFDSVHGNFSKKVSVEKNFLRVGSDMIPVFSEKDPANLPWKK